MTTPGIPNVEEKIVILLILCKVRYWYVGYAGFHWADLSPPHCLILQLTFATWKIISEVVILQNLAKY